MAFSRDQILAVYDALGKETLRLLRDGPFKDNAGHESVRHGGDPHRASRHGTGSAPHHHHHDRERDHLPADIQAQLEQLQNHDPLTGLSNRRHLQQQFESALVEAATKGDKVAFLLMGLDHFKDLNNTLGHQIGDEILAQTGAIIQSMLRESDSVGRMGSDEFGLILRGLASEDEIEPFASKLLAAASKLILARTPLIPSGASVGAALFPDHGEGTDELLQNAEIALYQAKADGRGRCRVFNTQMRVSFVDRLQQLSSFRSAIETGKLKPFYQPQMRLSDRRSHGFEALARWILPSGKIIYPGQFQIALNDPDAAILLGDHMLQSISDDLRQWQTTQMPACKVSVNVTGPELKRGDYPKKVARLFEEKGIPLSQLTVEVTESVLLDDKSSEVAKAIAELRELGVSIALDDFGTGFASLTHLKSYAVDQLKIDKSFIAELPFNAGDRAIVRATLNLAKNLRIETVAEGVEDELQLKYLHSLGCDYGQGYFFSPAVPADEAEAYFRKYRAYKKAKLYQFVVPIQRLPF